MFDTMTMTKVVGGFCGTLLIFLLGSWVADVIYSSGEGGYGDIEQAYSIEVDSDTEEETVEEPEVPFEELLTLASADDGEGVFRACRACHAVEPGQHGTGPSLHGIVNREVGVADGFNYSGALSEVVEVWSPEELDGFIENPSDYAPGTSMGYAGLRDREDRADVIAYLDSLDE